MASHSMRQAWNESWVVNRTLFSRGEVEGEYVWTRVGIRGILGSNSGR